MIHDNENKYDTNLMKLCAPDSSNTYFECVATHIKDDLDLDSSHDLYDYVLYDAANIETTKCSSKTPSETRVYNTITSEFMKDNALIQLQQEFITHVGEKCDAKVLEKQVQQNSIIENALFAPISSDFYDKYNYIEHHSVQGVNHSSGLMSFINLYTLSSPLLSLLMPFFILLTPFLIMKVRGLNISFSNYFMMIKEVLSRLPIYRLFDFKNTTMSAKLSSLFGIFMYILQMYYNTKYCFTYVTKNQEINDVLVLLKKSLHNYSSISSVLSEVVIKTKAKLPCDAFNIVMNETSDFCDNLKKELYGCNEEYSVFSLNHVNTIGEKLVVYYKLRTNYNHIQEKLRQLFDITTLCYFYKNIHTNIQNGILNYAVFNSETQSDAPMVFTKMYFPTLLDKDEKEAIVYNSLSLDKSLVLSGPNASGKTTILKSLLFNALCVQQFGVGFFESCTVSKCFQKIESYINIVDTHDRNSLFQNEAQRMLTMLSVAKENDGPILFVVDELFSGTNVREASACGIATLRELLNYNNNTTCLTTHYYSICNYFAQKKYSNKIINMKMDCVKNENNVVQYSYTLKKGVSKICGGIDVLREAKYPENVISYASTLIDTLRI